jgi:surface protein
MFSGCSGLTSLNVSNWTMDVVTNTSNMFNSCKSLTRLDLSSWTTPALTNVKNMFYNCTSLTYLDLRNASFSKVTSTSYYTDMFTGVPADCEIIVKDDTQKSWITARFTTLTNVKTVAELEAA